MNTDNITLIIPLKIDSKDRERNINTILSFNLRHYNFKIIIKEVDIERKYYNSLLDNENITYIFEKSNSNYFHRTRILNDMLLMVKTKYVCNYDCDMLVPKNTMSEVLELLNSGNDLVFPYKKGVFLTGIANNSNEMNIIMNQLDNSYLENIICKYNKCLYKKGLPLFNHLGLGCIWTAGGIQFFNTTSYINGFGENENFIDWGPEDQERLFRFHLLGYKIAWLNQNSKSCGVAHLDHAKSEATSGENQYHIQNHKLWEKLVSEIHTREDVLRHINSSPYSIRFKKN